MPAAKRKQIKASAVQNIVDTSTSKITDTVSLAESTLGNHAKLSVKTLGVIRRLKKKKQTLQKRKTKAAQKHKTNPSAEGKKLIAATDKELKTVTREIDKNVRARKTVTEELSALRGAVRRLKAHASAIAKVEKELNKPPRKRRRRATKES